MTPDIDDETAKLAHLGFDLAKVSQYQVLCLPENVFAVGNPTDLVEADDTLTLSKLLKAAGVNCGTAHDFGIKVPILHRRSEDKWIGVIWLRDKFAAPILVSVLAGMITATVSNHEAQHVEAKVRVDIYTKRGANVTKILYNGDGETLLRMLKILGPNEKK